MRVEKNKLRRKKPSDDLQFLMGPYSIRPNFDGLQARVLVKRTTVRALIKHEEKTATISGEGGFKARSKGRGCLILPPPNSAFITIRFTTGN